MNHEHDGRVAAAVRRRPNAMRTVSKKTALRFFAVIPVSDAKVRRERVRRFGLEHRGRAHLRHALVLRQAHLQQREQHGVGVGGCLGPQPLQVDEAQGRAELGSILNAIPWREPYLQRAHSDEAVRVKKKPCRSHSPRTNKLCNRCGRLALPQFSSSISGSLQRVVTQKVSSTEAAPAGPTMLPDGGDCLFLFI